MRNIKLTVEYDGRRYSGWQRLGDSDKTIQGKIETTIEKMTEEKVEIIGSGRTDSGAHSRGQVANFKTESTMSLLEMQDYLNYYLPKDIVIKEIEEVPERFHARYNAKEKQYSYYVWNHRVPSVFDHHHSYHYVEKLDLDRLNEACEKLVGTHDFLGFSSLKKSKKSTTRTIDSITVEEEDGMLHFTFVGNGFLYNMVRIIMGTLLEIGDGTLEVSIIDDIFEQKVRRDAGKTVPAQALFLDSVTY